MSDDSGLPSPGPVAADLAAAVDALSDPFFVAGSDDRLRHWNRALADAADRGEEALAGLPVPELVADGDADRVRDALAAARENGGATVEASIPTADGGRYEFRFDRSVDGEGDDGPDELIVGLAREVTDRHRAAEVRRAMTDRMTDAFFAVDDGWRLTYLNARAREVLAAAMGRDPTEELEGLDLWEEIPEAVGTTFYEQYLEATETGSDVSFEAYYEPLDTWFAVRAYPSETGLSVYFRDVTEERRRREALETRERVLREMYEIIADRDRSFDAQVEALLELGREELDTAYGTLSEIRGEEYRFEIVAADDDSIEAGDVVPVSATNCEIAASTAETLVLGDVARDAPDRTDRAGYAEWGIACYLGAPVFADGEVYGTFCFYDTEPRAGQFSGWEVTLVDLMSRWVSSELGRQRVNERLERQNETLERFASVVSHDLRNPLNVLYGSLELAEETGDPTHFERGYRTVERMESLIEDLLALARVGEEITGTEPVSLPSLLADCRRVVDTAGAELVVGTDRTVRADEGRLRQLLENLLRNAVEHGGSGVTVTVGDLDDGSGFYVEDDGPGIPPEDRERVFESGFSTADDGTGFGLRIVERIAEAHGWTVDLTESDTGGARFEFTGVEG